MDLLAILRRSGGIDALARQIGLPPPAVAAAAEALLPVLLSDLRNHALVLGRGDSGIRALLAIIEDLGGGQLAADIMGPGPLTSDKGDRIMAQFLGSNEQRDYMASELAIVSGLEAGVLGRVTPLLAMLICGYIAARAGTDSLDGEGIDWLRELLMIDAGADSRADSRNAG